MNHCHEFIPVDLLQLNLIVLKGVLLKSSHIFILRITEPKNVFYVTILAEVYQSWACDHKSIFT